VEKKLRCPPKSLWHQPTTHETANTSAYKVHIHDNITMEQQEKAMATTPLNRSNNEKTKETIKKAVQKPKKKDKTQ